MNKFEDLDDTELYRSAIEDFALDVSEDDNRATLLAAFLETGIDWSDYVGQHPEVAPAVEAVREPEAPREGSVVTAKVLDAAAPGAVEGAPAPTVVVAQPLQVEPNTKWLIKMVRGNTLYETRGYKFTQQHPYALVDAADARFILEEEDGFRQALPSEVDEFYN